MMKIREVRGYDNIVAVLQRERHKYDTRPRYVTKKLILVYAFIGVGGVKKTHTMVHDSIRADYLRQTLDFLIKSDKEGTMKLVSYYLKVYERR